jgi:tRNA(Ile)-lysidine synthase
VQPFLTEGRVVVGVSGGADSLALAATVAHFARKGADIRAVVVDHQLQARSDEVAAQAAEKCEALGLPARVVAVHVGDSGGPEGAARDARLSALATEAGPGGQIMLAHTLDDQAETVLLGLGRGSGAHSLRAMAERSGQIIRPFLTLRRAETRRICELHQLSWWDDPHNRNPRYRRVRVREEVLPLLEDVLGGKVAEALARTAAMLRSDDDALDAWANSVEDDASFQRLRALPEAVRRRVLKRWAVSAGASGAEITSAHVLAMERLVLEQARPRRVELPGGVSAVKDTADRLTFLPTPVAG